MAADSNTESFGGRALRLGVVALFAGMIALAGLRSLPPLDRDESRFAQASTQMLETGDFVTIRFQDDERNKKPAGVYWLQAASVAAFSDVEKREIWAYRLPSMLGAILAAVFTYLAGARLYGPQTGFLAALLLAAAPVFAAEATIAKTDAMLLACVCAAQAAFIHIFARSKDEEPVGFAWPIVFWIALGAGILIKGPIAPLVVGLTGAAFFYRAREVRWIGALKPLLGLIILALMILPWAIAVGVATDGRFYAEALGRDMFGKIGAAQESHGGPPGYHLLLLAALLWPGAALIAPGLVQAWTTRRAWPAWFLLSWIVPTWLVFELTSTKLPHYTLPLYPAIAILAARAASVGAAARRPLVRRLGAGLYLAIGLVAAAAVVALPLVYGGESAGSTALPAVVIAAVAAGAAALFWLERSYQGGLVATLGGLLFAWAMMNAVLPKLDRLAISPRLSQALDDEGLHPLKDGAPAVSIAGYSEPSAVFLLGTQTKLTDGAGAFAHANAAGGAAVVEARQDAAFKEAAAAAGQAVRGLATIEGLNYSNGRETRLVIYRLASR